MSILHDDIQRQDEFYLNKKKAVWAAVIAEGCVVIAPVHGVNDPQDASNQAQHYYQDEDWFADNIVDCTELELGIYHDFYGGNFYTSIYESELLKQSMQSGIDWTKTQEPVQTMLSFFGGTYDGCDMMPICAGLLWFNDGHAYLWVSNFTNVNNLRQIVDIMDQYDGDVITALQHYLTLFELSKEYDGLMSDYSYGCYAITDNINMYHSEQTIKDQIKHIKIQLEERNAKKRTRKRK